MEKQTDIAPSSSRAPDPEVSARPRRRSFTAEYKMRILAETGAKDLAVGGVAAILRREGLYSSHLAEWRRGRQQGTLAALSKKRGRKSSRNPLAEEVERLQRENEKLKAKLAQAEVIIDVQKKVASLLGIPLKTPDDGESDS